MDIRESIDLVEASTVPAKLETTPLPYGERDLSPVLSADSINYHYGPPAKGYAKRFNAGEGDATFNRAGSFRHNKFFPQLQPPKGANRPRGAVLELIESKFKIYEDFREEFKNNHGDSRKRLDLSQHRWQNQNHKKSCCLNRYLCSGRYVGGSMEHVLPVGQRALSGQHLANH